MAYYRSTRRPTGRNPRSVKALAYKIAKMLKPRRSTRRRFY
jgi:hypothetical protein